MNTTLGQLGEVLPGEALVWGDEQNVVEGGAPVGTAKKGFRVGAVLEVVLDLPQGNVKEERLAGAGRHEEGEAAEIVGAEVRELGEERLVLVEMVDESVDVGEEA